MSSPAPRADLTDPIQCMDAAHRLARRLADDLHVTIVYAALPDRQSSELVVTPTGRTLTIHPTLPLGELVQILQGALNHLIIGPHASGGMSQAHLTLVAGPGPLHDTAALTEPIPLPLPAPMPPLALYRPLNPHLN